MLKKMFRGLGCAALCAASLYAKDEIVKVAQDDDSSDTEVVVSGAGFGELAVPDATEKWQISVAKGSLVLANAFGTSVRTMDWHGPRSESFIGNSESGKWPAHCVRKTPGAKLILPYVPGQIVVKKAQGNKKESYSGVYNDSASGEKSNLVPDLNKREITTVIGYGLASDYCVPATLGDLIKEGFRVYWSIDMSRGLANDTTIAQYKKMQAAGVVLLHTPGVEASYNAEFMKELDKNGVTYITTKGGYEGLVATINEKEREAAGPDGKVKIAEVAVDMQRCFCSKRDSVVKKMMVALKNTAKAVAQ